MTEKGTIRSLSAVSAPTPGGRAGREGDSVDWRSYGARGVSASGSGPSLWLRRNWLIALDNSGADVALSRRRVRRSVSTTVHSSGPCRQSSSITHSASAEASAVCVTCCWSIQRATLLGTGRPVPAAATSPSRRCFQKQTGPRLSCTRSCQDRTECPVAGNREPVQVLLPHLSPNGSLAVLSGR
jgi:hypothetical protein